MKKRVLLSLMLSLVAVLGCCFSFNSKNNVVFAAAAESVESYYLINNGTPYKANQSVGTASGYGQYKVGDENVSISASALNGYKLVGWQVTLTEENPNTNIYINDTNLVDNCKIYTFTTKENDNGETASVDAIITFADTNNDGCYDSGSMQLAEVFEDMIVEPVFDFIYYQVEITSFVDKIKLPTNKIEDFNGYTVYYEPNENPSGSGYNEVVNTIIKDSTDKYFYIGDAYIDTAAGKAYAKHQTLQEQSVSSVQFVDMIENNGAFRLNQEVNIDLNINTKANIDDSVNIDVIGANIAAKTNINLNKATSSLSLNSYKLTTDSYKRTSGIAFKFAITEAVNLINNLNISYHNLHVVTLNRTINSENASQVAYTINHYKDVEISGKTYSDLYERSGEFYQIEGGVRKAVSVPIGTDLPTPTQETVNDIEQFFSISNDANVAAFINVSFYHAVVNEVTYLVKDASKTTGPNFKVSCTASYSEIYGTRYNYYSFNTMLATATNKVETTGTETDKSFKILENTTINIDYLPTEYKVEFKTAVIKNGEIEPVELSNNINDLNLVPGQVETVNTSAENIGYTFKGYALNKSENINNLPTELSVKVNYINPTSKTILVCYEFATYNLKIQNLNQKSVSNGTTIYPLKSLTLNYLRDGNNLSSNAASIESTIIFNNLQIGDVLSLSYVLNRGFKFYGFSFNSAVADITNSENFVTSIVVDETLLNGLTNNTIELYAYEDYETYSLTYYIEKVENTIMAKISATAPVHATIVQKNILDEDVADASVADKVVTTIVITNLRLYDVVNLNSEGFEIPDAAGTIYAFNLFISEGVEQSKTNSGDVYTHTESVNLSKSIKVVYSKPVTELIVTVNNINAFNLFVDETFNISVTGTIITTTKENTYIRYQFAIGTEVGISVDSTKINAGYILSGFSVTNNTLTSNNVENYSCGLTIAEGLQTITINFSAIEYRFVIQQYGAEFIEDRAGEQYGTGFTTEELSAKNIYYDSYNNYYYIILTVESSVLNIVKPTGYYVKSAESTASGITPQDNLSSSDENLFNNYIYSFTGTELVNFVKTNAVGDEIKVVVLELDYAIYTYHIITLYELPTNQDYLSEIEIPEFAITSSIVENEIKVIYGNDSYKTVQYFNIPYGARIQLSLSKDASKGVEKLGWFNTNIYAGITHDINSLTISQIADNYMFYYRLSLIDYNIQLDYNTFEGEPTVKVGGVINNIITLGKALEINTAAKKSEGFKLNWLAYKYSYNQLDWEKDWDKVYIPAGDGYELNTLEEYDPSTTYYVCVTDLNYLDTSFDISNYVVEYAATDVNHENPIVYFYITYGLLEISITHTNTDYNNLSLNNATNNIANLNKDMHIAYEDYALFTVIAKDTRLDDGEGRTITSDDKLTRWDQVTINIQINTNAQNRAVVKDGDSPVLDNAGNLTFEYIDQYFDLTNGLILASHNIGTGIPIVSEGGGLFTITFNVSEIIGSLPDSGEYLDVTYRYQVLKKELTVKTNIVNDATNNAIKNFYMSETKASSRLEITEYHGYGSSISRIKAGEVVATNTLQFLGRSYAICHLEDIQRSFKVVDVKAYIDGVEVENNSAIDVVFYTTEEITADKRGVKLVNVRYVGNIVVEFIVQPIIYFEGKEVTNEDYIFNREYDCDNYGNGKAVELTVGDISYKDTYDIAVPSLIGIGNVDVTYTQNGRETNPIDTGSYNVHLVFNKVDNTNWFSNIVLPISIKLEITPKRLLVDFNKNLITTNNVYIYREYDGGSELYGTINNYTGLSSKQYDNINDIFRFIVLKGSKGLEISYANIIDNGLYNENICLSNKNILTKITDSVLNPADQQYVQVAVTNAADYKYDLSISGVVLDETKSFNKNFELYFAEGSNNELIFTEFVKIDPRKVSLNLANIIVEDKVEDGLKNATLSLDSQFNLSNVVAGEELYIVPSKVTAVFDSETVGTNKTVTIDPTKALGGVNSTNYYIETSTVNNKVIYPYSIALEIAELGTFVLYNERGVTDATKANLIPIGSKLVVEVVNPETGEFVEIYDYIEKYLSTTKVFSVAYRVSLEVYNIKQPISNELFISVPYNSEVTQVIFLTGEETIEMPFAVEGNNVVIDLATLNLNVDTIVLLEKRALLKLWQIVLIVAGGVVVLGGIATAVVIIRIRKNRKNELLEKI